jgi:hypothetical protein
MLEHSPYWLISNILLPILHSRKALETSGVPAACESGVRSSQNPISCEVGFVTIVELSSCLNFHLLCSLMLR